MFFTHFEETWTEVLIFIGIENSAEKRLSAKVFQSLISLPITNYYL